MEACSELPELQILVEESSTKIIQKLDDMVKELKEQICKVHFEL